MGFYAFSAVSYYLSEHEAHYEEPLDTQLDCVYDIITSKDITFDTEGVQHKTSLLQAMVVPLGRPLFSTLPLRLAKSGKIIFNHENITEIFDDSFRAVGEKFR